MEHCGRQFFFVSYVGVIGQGLGAAELGHRVVGMFLPVFLPQSFLLEGVPGRLSLHQWHPAGGEVILQPLRKLPQTKNLKKPIAQPHSSQPKDFPLQGRKEKQMNGDP